MTKKEMAKAIATHQNSINNKINIERQTKVLMNGMTAHEMQKCLENISKNR